jgi:hypothetical protein
MPGAISGEVSAEDIYQFTTQATVDEIASYYETELASLGYQLAGSDDQGGYMQLSFSNGTAMVLVFIAPLEGLTGVVITISR